jgi:hypothetical protein
MRHYNSSSKQLLTPIQHECLAFVKDVFVVAHKIIIMGLNGRIYILRWPWSTGNELESEAPPSTINELFLRYVYESRTFCHIDSTEHKMSAEGEGENFLLHCHINVHDVMRNITFSAKL